MSHHDDRQTQGRRFHPIGWFAERFFYRVLTEVREQVGSTRAIVLAIQQELRVMRLEWEQFRDRVDKATTNIAGDLQRLKDRLDEQGQVSPEEKAEMERIASRLEAIAADPENPDPQDPNPVPEPGTGEGGGETGGAGESGTEGGQPSIT